MDKDILNAYIDSLQGMLQSAENSKQEGRSLEPAEFLAVVCNFVSENNHVTFADAVEDVAKRLLSGERQ